MTFTQIPPEMAPIGGELRYTVETDAPTTFDLQIVNGETGQIVGSKRFVGVEKASFDAAPYWRNTAKFEPTKGGTGFQMAYNRTVQGYVMVQERTASALKIAVEANNAATEPAAVESISEAKTPLQSEVHTFLPCKTEIAVPGLMTSMPQQRIIATEEREELTLVTEGPCTVTVTAQNGASATAESYRTTKGGVFLFVMNTNDFPQAETLTVDAGSCGTISYTVVPRIAGGRRLAWRSSAGSIEHYTFPIEKSENLEVDKKRAYGAKGHVAFAQAEEYRMKLISAYETRAVIEALTEILSSPEVWLVDGEKYQPIDVMTEKTLVNQHGAVTCMEIEIRPKSKTQMPWS